VPARIVVEPDAGGGYRVTVHEGQGLTVHHVTVEPAVHERLTGGRIPPEELVRRSFEFLLQREPKESILERFALPVIGRYFPDWEREMQRQLGIA
jgi:hypothetical protein